MQLLIVQLRRVVIMASTEGGVEIEKVAEKTPEKILKVISGSFGRRYALSSS